MNALYDQRGDFILPIVNFPFICSNNPATLAYGVYLFPVMNYANKKSGIRMKMWVNADLLK
jgi:hypothetical protein